VSSEELSNHIKKLAHESGFEKVGITPAKTYSEDKQHLDSWISKGRHATMEWVSQRSAERADIFNYFPEAKTVIAVGMNYYTGLSPNNHSARFSNYAWGDDYHDLLKSRLYGMLKKLKNMDNSINGIACVDTSPVMEKAWAQRAGIGWVGKHTNLLTPDFSSWLFLGVLLLDVEVQYDQPFEEDLCGSCTACIDACPTDAIAGAYELDARRCISYLTIEHRGELPDELGNQLNDWIYGCDICQEVCPWSIKFSQETQESSFQSRGDIKERSIAQWRELTEEDFKKLFKKSAVKRTKFIGLKRNIDQVFNLEKTK